MKKKVILFMAIVLVSVPVFLNGALANAQAASGSWNNGTQISLDRGSATISRAGTYVLSGRLRNGQVLIDAGKNDSVRIVLNGAYIENPSGAAIYAKNAAEIILTLADGTENTLIDGKNYVFPPGEDEPKACLFVKNNLTINGNGKLNVTGNYNNGIHAKDMLVINAGNIRVSAVEDALRGGDGVEISDGVFDISAEKDGVKSSNGDPGKGDVTIKGGTFTVKVGDDAIHAENVLRISGGTINILASNEGLEGKAVEISGGDISVVSSDDGINAADGSAAGGRGRWGTSANSNMYARISGGVIRVLAGGDGVDANGNLFLEGGELYISGPSMGMQGAIDFDGSFVVKGGKLATAGSTLSPAAQSTQPVILVSYTAARENGSLLAIKDRSGRTLLEYTARTSFTASAFSSPEFKTGETYGLYLNGRKLTDVTVRGTVTALADNGGAYALRGGGRGW